MAVKKAPTTRVDEFAEVDHGRTLTDPYRWMEDGNSPEVRAWVDAQNAYTRSLLDALPGRDDLRARLSELLAIGTVETPVPRAGRYFYRRREGEQNQPVLYVRDGVAGEERVVFDPNAESAEGLASLDWWYPSADGSLLAYGVSWHGDEWSTLHVLEVESGRRLPDRLERTFLASVAWLPDNSGFYYTRNPLPGEVSPEEEKFHRTVALHRLGDARADDREIDFATLAPTDRPAVLVSPDGRWLAIKVVRDWARHNLYLLDRKSTDQCIVPLAVGLDAHFNLEFAGNRLLVHTNLDAPWYRLAEVDPDDPDPSRWTDVIAEREDHLLVKATPAGGTIVAAYLHEVRSELTICSATGTPLRDIALPGIGTVAIWHPDLGAGIGVAGEWDRPHAFYTFQSFAAPPAVYALDTASGDPAVWMQVEAPIQPAEYVTTQEWYSSRDGTRVPMFVVHRADLELSSPRPAMMTGYGGFGFSFLPALQRGALAWLDRGGIFALPSLRGGGEFGTAWHRAGQRERKQNVFDDFIAAAEHLIDRGYTEPAKLAICGLSNGGLLVGAALTQRPDLFRAAVCGVAPLDMLRLLRLPPGPIWFPEFGDPDDPEAFEYLLAYSPYHQVREGTSYPAVLLTTGEMDMRVNPLHARKMAARLQAVTASHGPVLLRVERQAGHGVGVPLNKQVDEQTDIWSFISWQLGVDGSP